MRDNSSGRMNWPLIIVGSFLALAPLLYLALAWFINWPTEWNQSAIIRLLVLEAPVPALVLLVHVFFTAMLWGSLVLRSRSR